VPPISELKLEKKGSKESHTKRKATTIRRRLIPNLSAAIGQGGKGEKTNKTGFFGAYQMATHCNQGKLGEKKKEVGEPLQKREKAPRRTPFGS